MTKYIGALTLSLILSACGQNHQTDIIKGIDGKDGKDGVSCIATDEVVDGVKIGARITCGNTFALVLNGTNGADGKDGVDGQDGKDGVDGADGQDGTNGTNGKDGKDAVSISGRVASTSECINGGYVLTLDIISYTVCNGATGPQGPTGSAGVTPVLLCNKEYGLKVGNQLYAVYHQEIYAGNSGNNGNTNSKYSNTYLALLNPGPYQTTDGTQCNFTVNADGSISR